MSDVRHEIEGVRQFVRGYVRGHFTNLCGCGTKILVRSLRRKCSEMSQTGSPRVGTTPPLSFFQKRSDSLHLLQEWTTNTRLGMGLARALVVRSSGWFRSLILQHWKEELTVNPRLDQAVRQENHHVDACRSDPALTGPKGESLAIWLWQRHIWLLAPWSKNGKNWPLGSFDEALAPWKLTMVQNFTSNVLFIFNSSGGYAGPNIHLV
jgi:hypothetical protein